MAGQQQGDFVAGLLTGAVIGGIVGGVIGAVLAPKLSRRVLASSEDDLPNSDPRRESHKHSHKLAIGQLQTSSDVADQDITEARRTLEQKIAELNEAIRDTRAQLLVNDPAPRQSPD